jgi:hypothetical protein
VLDIDVPVTTEKLGGQDHAASPDVAGPQHQKRVSGTRSGPWDKPR